MTKITFIGAGSSVFAKNVLGDCILTPEIGDFEIALYDIDEKRLNESYEMLLCINQKYQGKATIKQYKDRKESLRGADFVFNCIQVGGYKPSTVVDFEVPKKYGLRQTIADTLGIGGIFRALRTIPVLEGIAEDMHQVAPNALFLNYTNPMSVLSGYMQKYLNVKTVGLCHSVQVCVNRLFKSLGMDSSNVIYDIAGVNHQAWLLKIEDENHNDLYPEIKCRSKELGEKVTVIGSTLEDPDIVRHEILRRFGYYNTESSEHTAEYLPYFIKSNYPELIDKYKIPLDEYLVRCERAIVKWETIKQQIIGNKDIEHKKSNEFGASIVKSIVTGEPCRIHGNVMNDGLITNLPNGCNVEVPCLVDRSGVHPCYIGDLPEQCAALNRLMVNVHMLTMKAAHTRKKEDLYMAAYLDPHTSSELSLDDIEKMCNDLIKAHKGWLPEFK